MIVVGLFFDIIFFASYFSILIVFLTIAIILSKKLSAWIWYSIGAIVTFFSVYGNQISYDYSTAVYDPSIYWMIYIALLLISGVIIFTRYSTSQENSPKFYELYPEDPELNIKKTDKPKKIYTKKPHLIIKKIINILKCIFFIPLSILAADILLMLVFGNSVEGALALFLLFIVSALIFSLLCYLFLGRKKHSKKISIKFEKINSRDKAHEEFLKGNLEVLFLIPPMFGGSIDDDNILYVPIGVNKLKESCDNIVAELLDEGKVKSYGCHPEYEGESFIPSKLTITSGKDGNILFEETINVW